MAHPQKPYFVSAKWTIPFKSAGASVQSTTGSQGVHIRGSNAGYTMFWGSVKGTGCPLHSTISPSLPFPCVTVCHHISAGLYPLNRRLDGTYELVWELGIRHKSPALCQKLSHESDSIIRCCDTLSMGNWCLSFQGTQSPHQQKESWTSGPFQHEGDMFPQNVRNRLTNDMAPYPSIMESSNTLAWKPQNAVHERSVPQSPKPGSHATQGF